MMPDAAIPIAHALVMIQAGDNPFKGVPNEVALQIVTNAQVDGKRLVTPKIVAKLYKQQLGNKAK